MKRLLTMLMLAIGIGTVALSVTGKHGQGIDWQQLNLTAQQDSQVEVINKEYQDSFQLLRKQELDGRQRQMCIRDRARSRDERIDNDFRSAK